MIFPYGVSARAAAPMAIESSTSRTGVVPDRILNVPVWVDGYIVRTTLWRRGQSIIHEILFELTSRKINDGIRNNPNKSEPAVICVSRFSRPAHSQCL
ncbi:hypothetical protein BVI2075_70103 [Burkholderia vietnamiensis]|nr:hypothetical protein BVI2075_70103 [Burkholderia vietnamiensis]CAG9222318.1 hypothetical protein BVI1335_400065 [Burkholderia vietnamiensis]